MAEWNLFRLDTPRPEHRALARREIELSVTDQIDHLLSHYGTVQRDVAVPILGEDGDVFNEFFSVVDLEKLLEGGSELYIGQLPKINGEILGRKGLHSLALTQGSGRMVLDLAVQSETLTESLSIVDSTGNTPSTEVIDELNDALGVLREGFETTRPRNQFPIDPSRFPRQQKPFKSDYCRYHKSGLKN